MSWATFKCTARKCFYDWNINLVANPNGLEAPNGDIVSRVRFESVMTPSEKPKRKDRQETLASRIEKTNRASELETAGDCTSLPLTHPLRSAYLEIISKYTRFLAHKKRNRHFDRSRHNHFSGREKIIPHNSRRSAILNRFLCQSNIIARRKRKDCSLGINLILIWECANWKLFRWNGEADRKP